VVSTVIVTGLVTLGGSAQAAPVHQTALAAWAGELPASVSSAPGQITSPADGQVMSSGSVTVSARTGLLQLKMGLYVEGPGTPRQKVTEGGANQTISGTFDAGSAPNGSFTVILRGEITRSTYATSTFKLRRPASPPSGVAAKLQGTRNVVVTWGKGDEPDLQSYEVTTSQSGVVGRMSVDQACAGSSCKAVLAVPAKAAGRRVGFTIKAFRGDGDGGSLGSGRSGAAYVMIPAPPVVQAKKATKQPTTPEAKDDSRAVEPLPTLPSKKRAQPTVAPTRKSAVRKDTTLPVMPDADIKGNLPIPDVDPDGATKEPEEEVGTLTPATEDGTLTPATEDGAGDTAPVASGVKAQSSESSIGGIGQYGIYVAGGLILLLLAAHGGAWARRRSLASDGGSAPAAGPATPGPATAGPAVAGHAAVFRRTATARHATTRHAVTTRDTAASRHTAGSGHVATSGPAAASSGTASWIGTMSRSAAPIAGGAAARQGSGEGLPSGAAPRRPTVILAIAKPSSSQPDAPAESLSPTQGVGSAEVLAIAKPPSSQPDAPTPSPGPPQDTGSADAREQVGVAEGVMGQAGMESGRRPEQIVTHSSGVLPPEPRYDDIRAAQRQPERRVTDDRQKPMRIALPSSAVVDVPEPLRTARPPDVRIEERWNDYLPPSPRSMEDSGFWERPQPGSGDFWASDDDERAYVGRRHRGGES